MSLSDIARRLATHSGLRHLLFLAAALLSILLIGYHFGTFDQVVHIPFMKAGAQPSLYPGDGFVALRNPPTSFFWYLFIHKAEAVPLGICKMIFGQDVLISQMPWPVVDPILVAFPLAMIVTVVVSLFTKKPEDKHLNGCFKGIK